jgi:DNA processing protein
MSAVRTAESAGAGLTGEDRKEVRAARAWLSRAVEPGDAGVYWLVRRYGPVEARRLLQTALVRDGVVRRAVRWREEDRSAEDLATAARLGVRLVTPEDDEWPAASLQAMEAATAQGASDLAPPLALWVRGPRLVDEATAQAVAIVGARDATPYGVRVAADLAGGLAQHGWTVVSGGAYGIDGAAHRGALAVDSTTMAVLANGLLSPYPAGHATLFDRIVEAGLLISEWPPDCAAQRHRFPIRNRLIAALSSGTVVVEAGARSGVFSTVQRARGLQRPVMGVPGPVTSAQSAGCHRLLQREGVQLITGVQDVLEILGAGTGDEHRPAADLAAALRLEPHELMPSSTAILDEPGERGGASS